jgi:hypothetical protein
MYIYINTHTPQTHTRNSGMDVDDGAKPDNAEPEEEKALFRVLEEKEIGVGECMCVCVCVCT